MPLTRVKISFVGSAFRSINLKRKDIKSETNKN